VKTQQAIDKAFEAILEIKTQLERQVRSLDEQIRGARLEHLESSLQETSEALAECVEGIDQQLIKLSVYVEEYQRLYAKLKDLSEKEIPDSGGTAPAVPEPVAGDSFAAIVVARIDHLKSQGKI
jgi:DNA repair exonuclease SbcCD ATPase subunit